MQRKLLMLGAIIPILVLTAQSAAAFQYTGNGYNDGVNAAREDAVGGVNDGSCNDHLGANFNIGHEGYCASFKIGYAAEMAGASVTK